MMNDIELCYMSATEALRLFKTRKLSPVELLDALIQRADAINPKINAFNICLFEEARKTAKHAEAEYQKSNGKPRPLEGIPIAIKDGHRMEGAITTYGSKIFVANRDLTSELHIERLINAGAVVMARTTCPEFLCTPFTHSPLWGISRNPWNQEYTPGGSSGGAASALAAGMVTLADGSDYGGSIRIPASCCGIFGYKPPYGRVPIGIGWCFDIYDHVGPMSRTVSDGALMLNIMSGVHPLDPVSQRQEVKIPNDLPDIKGFKVAISPNLGFFEVDGDVLRVFENTVEVFRELGCEVEEINLPWNSSTLAAWMDHGCGGFATSVLPFMGLFRYELSDYVLEVTRRGEHVSMTNLYRGYQTAYEMYSCLGPILEKFDIMLCPTNALPAVKADFSISDGLVINDKPVEPYIGWCMTFPFNMLGTLPVASVPGGFAKNGIPIGVQIVGRSYDDISVFRAAAAYERVRPWLDKRESRPDL